MNAITYRRNLFTACALAAILAASGTSADTAAGKAGDSSGGLFQRIEALDRALFEAFNRCELEKLGSFFIADLEFYHDNDGLTTSRAKFIGDVRKNICGKFRRELVTGTMEVWPLGEYGAVYSGTHRFCKTGTGKCDGQGKFMHVVQNKNGEWKLTRVISYDHKAAP